MKKLWTMLFPEFADRAVTFSYDDGVIYDEKLIGILNAYGMKGTFNINSGLFSTGRRMSKENALRIYAESGHEIALHGEKHLHLSQLSAEQQDDEIKTDRKNLEKMFARTVNGMAYAYGDYNSEVIGRLKANGVIYARTTKSTYDFGFPEEWLAWHPTCHHTEECLWELAERFLTIEANGEAKLFYLWGHSYEFNDHDNWDVFEKFCSLISKATNLWKATNGEIYTYVNAFRNIEYSAEEGKLRNPTSEDLYLRINGGNVKLFAGEGLKI